MNLKTEFEKKTGESHNERNLHPETYAPTWQYVDWLEKELERARNERDDAEESINSILDEMK